MKKITFKLLMSALFVVASYQVNAQCSTSSEPTDECADVFTISLNLPENTAAAAPGDKYYLRSNGGEPWAGFGSTNVEVMDLAFGAGGWSLETFQDLTFADVFNSDTVFVFMDGSDNGANALEAFLTANITAIEEWVFDGGSLIINSAPNQGDGMDLGFGGTVLNYPVFNGSVEADASHPAITGPNTPTATSMTGDSYGHATITATDFTTIVEGLDQAGDVVLAERPWGEGFIMVGGMTTVNFHGPLTEAANFRANLFVYMDENSLLSADEFTTSNFSIYPSVADATIQISAENSIDEIAMYNVIGQEVLRQDIGTTQTTINISSLTKGVYFVKVSVNGATAVKRIIKK